GCSLKNGSAGPLGGKRCGRGDGPADSKIIQLRIPVFATSRGSPSSCSGPNSARRTIQSGATQRSGATGKGTPASRACLVSPPSPQPKSTPSSASATGASSNAVASSKPSSWSPAQAACPLTKHFRVRQRSVLCVGGVVVGVVFGS